MIDSFVIGIVISIVLISSVTINCVIFNSAVICSERGEMLRWEVEENGQDSYKLLVSSFLFSLFFLSLSLLSFLFSLLSLLSMTTRYNVRTFTTMVMS